MSDIILVQPPICDFYLTAKRTVPYGLACLAGQLLLNGYSVEILDALASTRSKKAALPPEMAYLRDFYSAPDISPFSMFHGFRRFGLDAEELGGKVQNSGPFMVGISSLFTAYSDEALKTAKAVKRMCPQSFVVLGGHHPTEMPEEVLRYDFVDFIIRGEGEISIVLLADALRSKGSVDLIPGIGFKKHDGKFHINPPASLGNLEEVAMPAAELIDNNFYRRGKKNCAVIVTGRGCPLNCSYCSIGCSSWRGFRLKSVSRVIEEMKRAVFGIGARFIDFEDENISYYREWFLDLLNEIERQFGGCGLELRAMNGLYPPTLDEEVICAMKAAGFTALNLSLCTTSCNQLKKFRRGDVRRHFEASLRLAEKYRLETVAYIIAGAPGQDPRDSLADLLYLADKNAIAGVSVFYPAPGSADFNRCITENRLPPAFCQFRSTALPISDITTREDTVTLLRLARILNFFKSLKPEEKKEVFRIAGEAENRVSVLPASDAPHSIEARSAERRRIGKTLLGVFFRDGVIYGVSRDGQSFPHRVSDALCREFRRGLLKLLA